MKPTVLGALLTAAALAHGAMVTQRWGAGGRVHHPGTLKREALGKDGALLAFDLSALPKGAKVYRARLVFSGTNWHDVAFDIAPANREGDAKPKATGEPLKLVPPWYKWFDATAAVRAWTKAGAGRGILWLRRAPRFDQDSPYLEIAYEGKLVGPPEQATGVRAVSRSGQVFITFQEIGEEGGLLEDAKDETTWGELSKQIKVDFYGPLPNDARRELRYRVYRHTRPITAQTIGEAELLGEVVPGSCINTRMGMERDTRRKETRARRITREFGSTAHVVALRLAVQPGKPVAAGTGIYVHTVGRAGKGYYAVLTAMNGTTNTIEISADNAVGPIDETPAPPEPVLYKQFTYVVRDAVYWQQWYSFWTVPPLSPWPARYDLAVGFCPKLLARPAPLHVIRGHSWTSYPEPPRQHETSAINVTLCSDVPNEFYTGSHESVRTLRGFDGGRWQPFTPRRQDALVAWMRRTWPIDPHRIVSHVGAWGMQEIRQGDVYATLRGWGLPELTKGFQAWGRACGVWGKPAMYEGRPRDENPFVASNLTDWVLAHPDRELPYFWIHTGWGAHFTEMGWPPFPRFLWAMMKTKRAFVYSPRRSPVAEAIDKGQIDIRRNQSVPAFAHCSADDNVGEGELGSGDGWASATINGYLLWDTETIVDEPGRWEMTLWLDKACWSPDCTVDLTPRRCQKFKLRRAESFAWRNASLTEDKEFQAGSAVADEHGLPTIRKLKVTKARHRVRITRSPAGAPRPGGP